MKKLIKLYIVASFGMIMLASCNKSFLDERVYSNYSPSVLTDSLGFEALIAGLSNHMSTLLTYSNNQGYIDCWQVGTDIAYAVAPEGAEVPYYNYSTLTPTDNAANITWGWCYRMVNNTNNIISSIEAPGLVMSQGNKNYIDAEAKFYRAYAYNMLATLWGKVPLILQPLSEPKTNFTRTSLDSVNNSIVNDLTFAATNLPDIDNVKSNSNGKMTQRPNKAMAQQLLAEVYLRMGKNDLAEQQAQAVISSGKFSLIKARYGVKASAPGDYYSDMFWYGNQRRKQGNTE